MVDSDLAKLYGVETKRINEAVKNNPIKFPERIAFRITEKEYSDLKSKISTSSLNTNYGGSRKGHTVFTETAVTMLATVLKSKIAAEITIRIVDTFVAMRHYIGNNLIEQKYINNLVIEHDDKIKLLESSFQKLGEKNKTSDIYFNGQIFDAYSNIYKIFSDAKKSLVIVDGYANNVVLDIIKRLNIDVTIITKSNNLLTKQDIEKYNKQYHNLRVIYDNTFHDRYFILDDNVVYHCGTSINRIGYKTFCINLIADKKIKDALINKVNQIRKSVLNEL